MKTIPINAEVRERTGKGGARTARREGKLPGVLYGQGKSIHLSVDRREFTRALNEAQDENALFDIKVPGESAALTSIAREIQHDPVSRIALHVDFQYVDLTKPIQVEVAIHLIGEAEGVKNFGGILEHVGREVEVQCLPTEIPTHIDVDVSALMVGDSIHVSDLPSEGFEILTLGSQVVAHVAAPTVEKEPEPEEGALAEGEAAEGEGADGEKKSDDESKGDGE
ncbi:MAG TPA: 50S ribosomal protein L25 [bacterium]|nr:50S ribosomal protein L25 [bacterium]